MIKPISPYFAAVDLGSNSFHMLVVRVEQNKIETVDREKEMVQIARGLKSGEELTEAAQTRALNCLARFAERLKDIPKDQTRIVGTKALRSAKSAAKFLRKAEQLLGIPIQIISGYEEARLVYVGLAHSIDNSYQRLVCDIGGGSTEFVIGQGQSAKKLESLALGCVTYTEKEQLITGQIDYQRMKNAYLNARQELQSIRTAYLKMGWEIAYGTSGTWRAIAELLREVDGGAVINVDSLNTLYEEVASSGEVNSTRAGDLRKSVLPAGLAIAKAIFDALELKTLRVADASLKEGLIYDTIGRFSEQDSRVETVSKLQRRYNIDIKQAKRVAGLALNLWRQIDSPHLPGISRTKILAWSAELHEIGLSISQNNHHNHGYYILRYSDLAGFGRYEQYILANLVRGHRRKPHRDKFDDLDNFSFEALLPLILCLRLSVLLYRGREDLGFVPTLKHDAQQYCLKFPSNWLCEHPLSTRSLEQEKSNLKKIGLSIVIE